jgi:rod shape-determining protein MreB and related proteins
MAAVPTALGETSPELVADSMEHGIGLVGSVLLKGLNRRIAAETTMPVDIAKDLLACVACGAGSRTRRTRRC